MLTIKQMKVIVDLVEPHNPDRSIQFNSWGDEIDDYSNVLVYIDHKLTRDEKRMLEAAGLQYGEKRGQTWIGTGDLWRM